jgi:excisionase family DNA binding protein
MHTNTTPDTPEDYCGTTYAAKLLGLSVGTIQTLVEKNELLAWKTQGGHRRISMPSIREYQRKHNMLTIQSEPRDTRLRVLLVEDDAVTREMLRGYCNRSSMPVDCTAMSSGLEALIDISSIKPDILITDLAMPGVDGFELLRTLHQNPNFNRMTTLVLTALTSEEIENRGGLPEGSIFMAKPINMDWFNGFFTAFLAGRFTEAHGQQASKSLSTARLDSSRSVLPA